MGNGKHIPVDHHGREYSSIKEMCEVYGVSVTVFGHRMRRHAGDLRYALEGGLFEDPFEPGQRYDYLYLLCRKYNVPLGECRKRLASGMTLRDALTKPEPSKSQRLDTTIVVSEDEVYPNLLVACEANHITTAVVRKRLSYGWTIERALHEPIRPYTKRSSVDRREKEFRSPKYKKRRRRKRTSKSN